MKYNRDFLLFLGKEPKNVDDEDIKKYLYYVVEGKKKVPSQAVCKFTCN